MHKYGCYSVNINTLCKVVLTLGELSYRHQTPFLRPIATYCRKSGFNALKRVSFYFFLLNNNHKFLDYRGAFKGVRERFFSN
jgi:hypothetical protein